MSIWDSPVVLAAFQPRQVSPPRSNTRGHFLGRGPFAQPQPQLLSPARVSVEKAKVEYPPVEDRLLESRKIYAARRAQRQASEIAKEVAQLRATPTIDPRSARIAVATTPVYERLALRRREDDPGRSTNEEASNEKSKSVKLEINERSRALTPRGAEGFMRWEKERRARVAAHAAETERAKVRHVTGTPWINPRSRQIAASMRGAKEGLSVEDELIAWQQTAEHRVAEERKRKELELRRSVTPHAGLDAQTAATRLYEDAVMRESERDRRAMEEELLQLIDPLTGQVRFHPQVHVPPSAKPHADLYETSRTPSRSCQSYDHQFSFRPKVGAYSALLAELRNGREEDPLRVTVIDRLAASKAVQIVPLESSKDGFTPRINPHSRAIDKFRRSRTPSGPMPRVNLLQQQKMLYETHRERLVKEREALEVAPCTWRPKINHRPVSPTQPTTTMRFMERQQHWAARRDAKLETRRSAMEAVYNT